MSDEHERWRRWDSLVDTAISSLERLLPEPPDSRLHLASGQQLDCCGTCQAWSASQEDRYCPVVGRALPAGDLRYWRCNAWEQELCESYAVELARELEGS